jgi:hypothetical protein
MVRTSLDEVAIVVATNPTDPLHPMLALVDASSHGPGGRIDASVRDASGVYERHIVETLMPHVELDVTKFLAAAPA